MIRALLLAACTVAAYAASLGAVFQFDDYNVIVANPAVHSWAGWLEDLGRGIRPILKASYTLNWTLGPGATGFHAFNIAVHALNAALVYVIGVLLAAAWAGREASPLQRRAALFAALLFALHPVQTEAVTYVSGRSVSLAASFYLGALLVYLRRGPLWCSLALFVLAAGTRETALTLPAALLLCELSARERPRWKELARRQAAHWGLALVMLGAAVLHTNYAGFFRVAFRERGMGENLLIQVQGLGYLVSRLLAPHRLNIDPALPQVAAWDGAVVLQALLLGALLLLGLVSLRRRPWLGFGLCWFFVHLAPTNSMVPRLDVANERHLYLALWGLAVALTHQLACIDWPRLGVRPILARGLALGLLGVMATLCVARQLDYWSEIALWQATVREAPWNARAYNNLGYAHALAGEHARAIEAYAAALEFASADIKARANMDRALAARDSRRRAMPLPAPERDRPPPTPAGARTPPR